MRSATIAGSEHSLPCNVTWPGGSLFTRLGGYGIGPLISLWLFLNVSQGWPAGVSRRAPRKEMEVSLRSLELSLELSFFVDTVPRLKDGIPPSLHLRLRWRRDRPEQSAQEAPPAWYGNGLACLLPRQLDRDRHIRGPAKLRGRTARRTSANSSRSLSLSFLSTARHRCRAQQAMQRQNYTLLSPSCIPEDG